MLLACALIAGLASAFLTACGGGGGGDGASPINNPVPPTPVSGPSSAPLPASQTLTATFGNAAASITFSPIASGVSGTVTFPATSFGSAQGTVTLQSSLPAGVPQPAVAVIASITLTVNGPVSFNGTPTFNLSFAPGMLKGYGSVAFYDPTNAAIGWTTVLGPIAAAGTSLAFPSSASILPALNLTQGPTYVYGILSTAAQPAPTPTPTTTPTATPSPSPTLSPTASPSPTPSPTPTATPTPTPSPSPTPTLTPTPTAAPSGTPRPTPSPTASPLPTPTPTLEPACSGGRWPVKIASDSAAFSIPLADVQATTIASLVTLRPPAPLTNTTPRTMPIETTVYQLTNVRLVQAYEEHDNDYHLVLSDNAGHTMIAEVPQPSCALTSAVYNGILAVRSALNTQFPKLINGVNVTPNVSISVQGIGFWDTLNGTSGQAPNGIEIHPLTTICFGTNCTLNPQT